MSSPAANYILLAQYKVSSGMKVLASKVVYYVQLFRWVGFSSQ